MVHYSIVKGRNESIIRKYSGINVMACGGNRCSHLAKGERGKFNTQNKKQNNRKAIETIKELVSNNFDEINSSFVTLTFSDAEYDKVIASVTTVAVADVYKECNKLLRKFFKRVKTRYNGLHYLAVPELQKERGAIHYHLIWNIVDMGNAELLKIWKHGSIDTQKVYNERSLARYFCKDKHNRNEVENVRFNPQYLISKGLTRNKKIQSWKEYDKSFEVANSIKSRFEFVSQVTYPAVEGCEITKTVYKNDVPIFEVVAIAIRKK